MKNQMNFNGSHRFNRSLKIHIYIDVRRKYIEVDIYIYIYIHIKTKHTNDTKVKLVFKNKLNEKRYYIPLYLIFYIYINKHKNIFI